MKMNGYLLAGMALIIVNVYLLFVGNPALALIGIYNTISVIIIGAIMENT